MNAVGPVAAWALAALLGSALGSTGVVSPLAALLVGASALPVLLAARTARGTAAVAVPLVAIVVCAAALAAGRSGLRNGGPLAELAADGGHRDVVAVVVTEPRPTRHGWWAIVRVSRVAGESTRERAVLRGRDAPPPLRSVWQGRASARPVDQDGYLATQHAAAELRPSTWTHVAPPPAGWRASSWVRDRVALAAARYLPTAPAALAAGLVTGDTRRLPPEDEQAMLDTGLSHLIAVSGSNVAVVIAGVAILASLLGLPAAWRRRLMVVALLWFVVLTRAEPSVLRATTMALLVLAAGARGTTSDVRHALGAAVLVLLLLDPLLARSLGLLLSAGAALGVLVVAPLLRPRLRRLPRQVADLLAITLGAQLAVAPLLLWSHGEVPLASVPANLVAVPAAAIASVMVSAAALLALVHPVLAAPLLVLVRPALGVILAVAHGLRWRGGVISVARPVTVLACVALAAWLLSRPGTGLARVAAGVGLASMVAVGLPAVVGAPVRELVVTAIDVGQGDAILVESPGARILVDGGPDGRAARWLRGHGRREFDLVVLSHPHADHVDGLPEVLQQSQVGALWLRDIDSDLEAVAALRRVAADRQVPLHAPETAQRATVGDLVIDILGPPPGRPYRWTDSEPNDTSLVLRIRWRGLSVLLTGDAEQPAQRDLLEASPDLLRADLLKVPHHGGATSEPAFLRAVGAPVAVVSAGRGNSYGHPHPDVLEALRSTGTRLHRTDEEGTVRIPVRAARPVAAERDGRGSWLGSLHVHARAAARRRRRPAAPPRARAGPRRPPRRRPRARGRDPRRRRDRAPP